MQFFWQPKLFLFHWISTLDFTKFKVFADNKINVTQGFRIIVFERVEKFAGERENAGNHNFLLFQQHYQRASFGSEITRDCLEKRLPFPKQSLVFYVCSTSLKTLGKGEITGNEQFLLFPVFATHLENFLPFSSNLK